MADEERNEQEETRGEGAPEEAAEQPEQPAAEEQPAPSEPQEQPAAEEQPAAQEPAAGEQPPAGDAAPAADEQPAAAEPPAPERRKKDDKEKREDVIPGAHLEPDIVLQDEARAEEGEFSEALLATEGVYEDGEAEPGAEEGEQEQPAAPVARTPLELAADARYTATGKRKTAVARVILKPGSGTYLINGRTLEDFFPRITLQQTAREPLETAGYQTSMDVVARIHGGGVSSQAGALRHGVARALIEADPELRGELKRRGLLTRDPRVKERKKAGLKKARKRPQFSKR